MGNKMETAGAEIAGAVDAKGVFVSKKPDEGHVISFEEERVRRGFSPAEPTKKMPSAETLIKKRNEVAQKIEEANIKRLELLKEQLGKLDANKTSTGELIDYLPEAKKNLRFYEELEDRKQLPPENESDLKKARDLVEKIEARIEGSREEGRKILNIPDVKDVVYDEASKQNEEFERKKKQKRAEADLIGWLTDINSKIAEIREKMKEKQEPLEKSEDKLEKLLKDKKLSGFHMNGNLRRELEEYKDRQGWFKKGPAKAILASEELAEFEKCYEDKELLGVKDRFGGGYENIYNIVPHILRNDKSLEKEFKRIIKEMPEQWKAYAILKKDGEEKEGIDFSKIMSDVEKYGMV